MRTSLFRKVIEMVFWINYHEYEIFFPIFFMDENWNLEEDSEGEFCDEERKKVRNQTESFSNFTLLWWSFNWENWFSKQWLHISNFEEHHSSLRIQALRYIFSKISYFRTFFETTYVTDWYGLPDIHFELHSSSTRGIF